MMAKLVRFVEKDVDGCGTSAEVLVSVETDEKIDVKAVQQTINMIKSEADSDDWDTDSIVEEACERCFGSKGIKYSSAAYAEIEF